MVKVFKRLNYIFLHDEDEQAPVSDYVWFYGFHIVMSLVATIFFIKIITF